MALAIEKEKLIQKAWEQLRREAQLLIDEDPWVQPVLYEKILNRSSFPDALANVLSTQINDPAMSGGMLHDLILRTYAKSPVLVYQSAVDLFATLERDPACNDLVEPLLFYKGFQSVQTYRVYHTLWKRKRTFLAKMLQSACSRSYEVDIHPAAEIGMGILIDHATNIVIGETAKVGNFVSILHGVTLGGTGKESGDRHPKIGDGVMLGAHAQLLGNIRVGRGAKVGAGAVVLQDVPPHTTYAGVPAVKVGKPSCDMPALEMTQDFLKDMDLDSPV